jgi:hypothetical protein
MLTTERGEGGGPGAKETYVGEKVWSSINHSIANTLCMVVFVIKFVISYLYYFTFGNVSTAHALQYKIFLYYFFLTVKCVKRRTVNIVTM